MNAKRPLILISNDDGITSPHILALADGVASIADVLVVAPERQRSAASHAITLHKPLRLHEVAPARFALSGTPADCVYVGMLKLAPRVFGRTPTLVLSGMNDGYNLGTDVFYSGTVAAAVEGALRGTPSIALSLAPRAPDPAGAVAFVVALVAEALRAPLPAGTVLNVNLPGAGERDYRWTVLGRRLYEDDVTESIDPRGRPYYWVGGGPTGHDPIHNSDCEAVAAGVISVTPMHLGLTAHALVEAAPLAPAGFRSTPQVVA